MTSNAGAPLLERQGDELEDENCLDDHHEQAPRNDTRHTGRLGVFVWLLTLSAGISGLLFGYDTGVISATLVSIGTSLSNRELTSLDKSIITSSTSLFALIASPLSSVLADRIGRKPIIVAADALFVFGALIQALSISVPVMVLGRSIVGLAIGAASFVTPLYLAELAPAAHRGTVVTMNAVSITFGQVVAYIVGWLFAEYGSATTGWRLMVGVGAAPAVLQCILLFIMPETPRWLVKANRSEEARTVIQKTCGTDPIALQMVNNVLRDIEVEVREEEESTGLHNGDGKANNSFLAGWRELILVPKNRRALTIACMLQGFQQLCGFNSLMYFSATIFLMLGFTVPTLTSLSVASTNFIFTVAALLLIDRIGRRGILLYSVPFMAFGLLATAFGFIMADLSTIDAHGPALTKSAAIFILANIIIYVASYAIGLGNVPWMQSELFPLNVRSMGSGLATATNWGANFIVGLTFLPLMDAIGASWTFTLYGIVCIIGWVAIWRIYPETVGISLEDVSGLLEHGWGVR
ncbi:putative MFS myo-inositol transporter [Xylaria bambusicola]|uniref:putative MFS myo-inositol transporter n=1 Tax=Xylaria bambusicola TaxID=326684 RepID=UPI002007CA75|nr:putative MFS myo-inositol transporter [Xylaria bambusicola]KAI0517369.1 putative MFS myo-inositol transporter [Xylaria bambusicola]